MPTAFMPLAQKGGRFVQGSNTKTPLLPSPKGRRSLIPSFLTGIQRFLSRICTTPILGAAMNPRNVSDSRIGTAS